MPPELWERASIPTAAVTCAGSPTVSSGSAITTTGSIFGWKMIFLVRSRTSVITDARPTSEPVPEVVGTATTGAMPPASARVHQSSRSSKSQTMTVLTGHQRHRLRGVERASSAEPDHPVMAAVVERPHALGHVRLHRVARARRRRRSQASPASRHDCAASATIGIEASPGSVTRSGRRIPISAHVCASSRMRPGPNRIGVG